MSSIEPSNRPTRLPAADPELSLAALWNLVWREKWVLLTVPLVVGLLVGIRVLTMPDVYTAETTLAPTQPPDARSNLQGALGSLGGLGGLASIAGIQVNASDVTPTDRAIAILESRAFARLFTERYDTVSVWFAREWNPFTRQWRVDPTLYDEKNKVWLVDRHGHRGPRSSDVYEKYRELLEVSRDRKTNLITLRFSAHDPRQAAAWLAALVRELNNYVRSVEMQEVENGLRYIDDRLNKTEISDMRRLLFQLQEENIRRQMLAHVREEYLLQTLDPPTIPDKPSSPRRVLMVVVAVAFGLLLAVAYLLLRNRAMLTKEADA